MKLKRLPEDFRVDERLSLRLGTGPFTVYRLTKRSLGTLEAIAAVMQHWKLPRQAIAFAGLKDKHALTTQHITIQNGPHRGFRQTNLELTHVGSLDRPLHASDIDANEFSVVIRDLTTEQATRITEKTEGTAFSYPNYFDQQRFGSLGESGTFIALPWCLGDYESALRLALTDPNKHDRAGTRAEKDFFRDHWGDWSACRRQYPNSTYAAVVNYLVQYPRDYRRAIARVPHDLRSLWLAAFQSYLWNQVLAALIQDSIPQDLTWQTVSRWRLPFFNRGISLDPRLFLPLPSARVHFNDLYAQNEKLSSLYHRVLADEGLQPRQLRVKYPRDSFFSKGDRRAVAMAVIRHEVAADDMYAGRHKLTLRFSLARGTYATMLLKRIVGEMPLAEEEETIGEP
jgi:tRNA pseudouridine13 synthase